MNVNYKIPSVLLLHFIMPKRRNNFLLVNSSPPAQTGSLLIRVYYSSPKRRRRAAPISQSSGMVSGDIFPHRHSMMQTILRSYLQLLSIWELIWTELCPLKYPDATLICKRNITLCSLLVEITKAHRSTVLNQWCPLPGMDRVPCEWALHPAQPFKSSGKVGFAPWSTDAVRAVPAAATEQSFHTLGRLYLLCQRHHLHSWGRTMSITCTRCILPNLLACIFCSKNNLWCLWRITLICKGSRCINPELTHFFWTDKRRASTK